MATPREHKPWLAVLEDGELFLAEGDSVEGYILLEHITRAELQALPPNCGDRTTRTRRKSSRSERDDTTDDRRERKLKVREGPRR
jgi:hypothetical protein